MTAKFMEKQPPVKIIEKEGKIFVFICLNETEVVESYEDASLTSYEYDYNDFVIPKTEIDLNDLKENPQDYLDYHVENTHIPSSDLEKRLTKLEAAIERGVTV